MLTETQDTVELTRADQLKMAHEQLKRVARMAEAGNIQIRGHQESIMSLRQQVLAYNREIAGIYQQFPELKPQL